MEKTNAKEMPKKFFARHMNNGLAGYESENILVSTDAMKRMCKSFDAKPVYVEHQGVDLEKLQEQAAGYVTRCFYNELDGWLWAEIIIVSDEGQEAVRKGWSVSNAYLPVKWGEGGTCHDIAYDREVLEGEFTHLAIVPNPRYEDAVIMNPDEFKAYQDEKKITLNELQNSKKEKKGSDMLKKIFVKKEVATVEELTNASYTLEDGSTVSIGDMISTVENAKKNEAEDKKEEEKINMDMEVPVGDEKMNLKELINRYLETTKEKANAEDEKKKDEDEKANAEEEAKKKEEDEKTKEDEKKNSKHFDELKNAAAKGKIEVSAPYLKMDGLALGKKNY